MTFGSDLRIAREVKKLSLREMEEKTGISNSYLSQLENNKVKEPSPNVLHVIAEAYGIPYIDLMEKAGYIVPRKEKNPIDGVVLSVLNGLDKEDIEEVKNYVRYIRMKKDKSYQE